MANGTSIDALICAGLPLEISQNRTDHLYPKALLACDERPRGDRARIQEMLCRQEISLLQVRMDVFCHRFVADGESGWLQHG
jgi:hypothetical protein